MCFVRDLFSTAFSMGLSTDYKMGGMINDTTRATLNTALDRNGRGYGILFQQHSMREGAAILNMGVHGKGGRKGSPLVLGSTVFFSGGYGYRGFGPHLQQDVEVPGLISQSHQQTLRGWNRSSRVCHPTVLPFFMFCETIAFPSAPLSSIYILADPLEARLNRPRLHA